MVSFPDLFETPKIVMLEWLTHIRGGEVWISQNPEFGQISPTVSIRCHAELVTDQTWAVYKVRSFQDLSHVIGKQKVELVNFAPSIDTAAALLRKASDRLRDNHGGFINRIAGISYREGASAPGLLTKLFTGEASAGDNNLREAYLRDVELTMKRRGWPPLPPHLIPAL